ncbi:MAG: DUF3368 domain-containing protein [Longimonas sp.]|uniref:DUF3368 domain-containing protein n=1 Tax=Longimonas sp. TaxID=2039626 RepID=UPI0033623701
MTVVSNAGPLIALARIRETEWLPRLYGDILVPEAVHREIIKPDKKRAGVDTFVNASWLRVESVSEQAAVRQLRSTLDAGESEAIVLALEREADILLMDEALGRRVADARGVALSGTLGVLLLAKEEGLIDDLTAVLDRLISTGFRIGDALYEFVLEQAGEA